MMWGTIATMLSQILHGNGVDPSRVKLTFTCDDQETLERLRTSLMRELVMDHGQPHNFALFKLGPLNVRMCSLDTSRAGLK